MAYRRHSEMYIMKKIISFVLLLCTIVFSGCASSTQIDFSSGKYSRESVYPVPFKTFCAEYNNSTYCFEEDILSREEATNIILTIENDKKIISDKLQKLKYTEPVNQSIKIYVVQSLLNRILIDDTTLFIDMAAFENGDYRYYLLQTMLGMNQGIKSYGLNCFIWDIAPDNSYIANQIENNRDVLDLFCGRMSDAFADEEERKLFQSVVNSISCSMIANNGLDYFLNHTFTTEDINNWLKSLGKSFEYNNSDLEVTQHFEVINDTDYSLVIKDDFVLYRINDDRHFFQDISEIEALLVNEHNVRKEFPAYFDALGIHNSAGQERLDHIIYNIEYSPNSLSYCHTRDVDYHWIEIRTPDERIMIHEMMHLYMSNSFITEDYYWLEEGLCEYFAWIVFCPDYLREGLYNALLDSDYCDGALQKYYLCKYNAMPDYSNYDLARVYDFYLYERNILHKPTEIDNSFEVTIGNAYASTAKGCELYYIEAMSFAGYMIDQYGMNEVMSFLQAEYTFEEYFGKDYDSLKEDWLNSLSVVK